MKVRIEEYPVDEHINERSAIIRMGTPAQSYDVQPGEKLFPNGRVIVFHGETPYYDGPPPTGYQWKGNREYELEG